MLRIRCARRSHPDEDKQLVLGVTEEGESGPSTARGSVTPAAACWPAALVTLEEKLRQSLGCKVKA